MTTLTTLCALLEETANEREDLRGRRILVNAVNGRLCAFADLGKPGQIDTVCTIDTAARLDDRRTRGAQAELIEAQFIDALDAYLVRSDIAQRVRESAYR